MKKIVFGFGLVIILNFAKLFAQTNDVIFIGRLSTEFTMPSSSNRQADINTSQLQFNPTDTSLSIIINLNSVHLIDTLDIFFTFYEYFNNSLINNDNFEVIYQPDIFSHLEVTFGSFQYYYNGILINSILKNKSPDVTFEIKLFHQNFIPYYWNLNFRLFTNIARGDAALFPLQIGNIWEYLDHDVDHYKYEIIDTNTINNCNYFTIEKSNLVGANWLSINIDTIRIDENNNIVNKSNHRYWTNLPERQRDKIDYCSDIGKILYLIDLDYSVPGAHWEGYAYPNIGIIKYKTYLTGFPPSINIKLLGAKINNSVVYGNLTSIDEGKHGNAISFFLNQNYPNPFNPSTKISWQAPVSGWQTLKVFNSLGQEVETVVDEYLESGFHSKLFIVNSTLPSGVYFYRLQAGDYLETKKMILLK